MCWSSRYYPRKIGVQNPLIVYKVVTYIDSSRCRSLYTYFNYIYKRVYKEPTNPEIRESKSLYRWEIYRGFHSYATMDRALREYEDAIKHCYGKVALVECIIPIGSIFYKNEKDEIVSNGIIINRILKTNTKLPYKWGILELSIIILLSCFILFLFSLFKVFIS
nr:MAG TPA: hypothetical protein [Crassvirales sp.]